MESPQQTVKVSLVERLPRSVYRCQTFHHRVGLFCDRLDHGSCFAFDYGSGCVVFDHVAVDNDHDHDHDDDEEEEDDDDDDDDEYERRQRW
mgnify:CR=1 FL=1